MQLIAMPGNVLRFDRDLVLEAGTECSAVGELNVDFGTVLAVFVDGEDADHFVGKFFTFNHRFSRGFSVVRPLPRTGLLERIPLRFTIRQTGCALSSLPSTDDARRMTVYLLSRLISGKERIR